VSNSIQARLDEFRQQRRVQAGSLILTAFGDVVVPRGGRLWLGSLIRLLAPLDINERLIRTAVFRLVREDWLQAETIGRRADYWLTESGRQRFSEAAQRIYATHAPAWDGCWRLILIVRELSPAQREKLKRALGWQGFGTVGSDCFAHPGASLAEAMATLVADGLGDLLPALLPLLTHDLRLPGLSGDAELVARAWNLERLADAYGRFVAHYRPILDEQRHRPAAVDKQDAFLLRLLLIHDYRRLLLRDPELPAVLLPANWPGEEARRICAELYGLLACASESYLDGALQLADGRVPQHAPNTPPRFPR
jgi:phenylacetic acid degradation operon negative regulatory protein